METSSQADKEVLKYDSIVVSPRGIAETSGKKVVVFVPAGDIERITLNYGRSDHRPIVSMSIGIVLAIVGVCGLIEFIIAPRGYRYEVGMMTFGAIGGSLIHDALKQRFYFEVSNKKGTRRLILSKHAKRGDIEDFCNKIRSIYKYEIADEHRHLHLESVA